MADLIVGPKKRGRPKGSKEAPGTRRGARTPREVEEPLEVDEREARAAAMLARRLTGDYMVEIAEKFGLTTKEVQGELEFARRKALHTKALDFITLTLMPKALAVYATALDNGNVDVATKVLEGLGVLGKQGGISILMQGGGDEGGESFEQWRVRLARNANGDTAIEATSARGPSGGVHDRTASGGGEDAAEIVEADVVPRRGENDVEGEG